MVMARSNFVLVYCSPKETQEDKLMRKEERVLKRFDSFFLSNQTKKKTTITSALNFFLTRVVEGLNKGLLRN